MSDSNFQTSLHSDASDAAVPPGASPAHCARCGRTIFRWERDTQLYGKTESGLVCIDCLKESDPDAAKRCLDRADRLSQPSEPESESDPESSDLSVPPISRFHFPIRVLPNLSVPVLRAHYFGGLLVGFGIGIAVIVIWHSLFRESPSFHHSETSAWFHPELYESVKSHSGDSSSTKSQETPSHPKEVQTKDAETDETAPSRETPAPSLPTQENPAEKLAAEQYARLLQTEPSPVQSIDDLRSRRDRFLKIANEYPNTGAAQQASQQAARLSEQIERRIDIRMESLKTRIRELQDSGKYLIADRAIRDGLRLLENATPAQRAASFEYLQTRLRENDRARQDAAESLENSADTAFTNGKYDEAEAIIRELLTSVDPVFHEKGKHAATRYLAELQAAAAFQARDALPRLRVLSDAFATFDRYIRSNEFSAAAIHARTYAASRNPESEADQRLAFQTAARAAEILQTFPRALIPLNHVPLDDKTIRIQEINGTQYEGKFGGIGIEGVLTIYSDKAFDASGNPIELVIEFSVMSTASWKVLADLLPETVPKKTREEIQDALRWRAVANGEVSPEEYEATASPAWKLRARLHRDLRILSESTEALSRMQEEMESRKYADAKEIMLLIRKKYLPVDSPISTRIRMETFSTEIRILELYRSSESRAFPAP